MSKPVDTDHLLQDYSTLRSVLESDDVTSMCAPTTIQLLKDFRNSCTEQEVQQAYTKSSAGSVLAAALTSLQTQLHLHPDASAVCKLLYQCLFNLVTNNEVAQLQVWDALVLSDGFVNGFRYQVDDSNVAMNCALIHNCTVRNKQLALKLVSYPSLLEALLETAVDEKQGCIEWVYFMVENLLTLDILVDAIQQLGNEYDRTELLSLSAEIIHKKCSSSSGGDACGPTTRLYLLKELLKCQQPVTATLQVKNVMTAVECLSDLSAVIAATLYTELIENHVLEFMVMQLMKGSHPVPPATRPQAQEAALLTDEVEETPATVKQQAESSTSFPPTASSTATDEQPVELQPQHMAGFKTELMRMLANVTYNNREAQDYFREHGILPVILSHCKIDERDPLLREWALFAIRNLLIHNEKNQELIESLELQGIVQDEALLAKAGLKAEFDPISRQVKFRPVSSDEQDPE